MSNSSKKKGRNAGTAVTEPEDDGMVSASSMPTPLPEAAAFVAALDEKQDEMLRQQQLMMQTMMSQMRQMLDERLGVITDRISSLENKQADVASPKVSLSAAAAPRITSTVDGPTAASTTFADAGQTRRRISSIGSEDPDNDNDGVRYGNNYDTNKTPHGRRMVTNTGISNNNGGIGTGGIHGDTRFPLLPTKIEGFSGEKKSQSVQSWVDQLTTIREITEWPDEIITKHAAMLLSGTAQQWYLTSGRHYHHSWQRFSTELVKKFTMEINPWLTAKYTENIRQKKEEPSRDFMDRVRRELRLLNITGEDRVCEVFLGGCLPEIGADIIRSIGRDPVDAKRLEEIAGRLEMANRMERKRLVGGLVPARIDAYISGDKLQLRKEGRCFLCKQPGHMASHCPKKGQENNDGGVRTVADATANGDWKRDLFCKVCKKKGHTSRYCPGNRFNETPTTSTHQQKKGDVRAVATVKFDEDDNDDEEDDDSYLGAITSVHQINAIDTQVQPVNQTEQASVKTYIVTGEVNGRRLDIMIDTGATVSCIRSEDLQRLRLRVQQQESSTTPYLEAANGGKLVVRGNVVLPLRVWTNRGVHDWKITFIVVDQLTAPCLLGTDFLNKYASGLCWVKKQERLLLRNGDYVALSRTPSTLAGVVEEKEQTKNTVCLIQTRSDLVLKASSICTVPDLCVSRLQSNSTDDVDGSQGDHVYDQPFTIEPAKSLAQDGVMMAPVVYDSSHVTIQLVNTTSKDLEYKKGKCLGSICSVEVLRRQEQGEIKVSEVVKEEVVQRIQGHISREYEDISTAVVTMVQRQRLELLLTQYYHLFDDRHLGTARQPTGTTAETVKHYIHTGDHPPIKSHAYRQSPAMEDIISKEIDKLIENGAVTHSTSAWASPIVMVRKPGGEWRMCIDYRALNKVTVPDVYPLPTVDQLLYSMGDAKVFTTMDLHSAYNQIEVAPEHRNKTAFIHRTGLYEYTRMPFGLINAPGSFQRFINTLIQSGINREQLYIYILAYLDDLIVFSKTFEEHMDHLSTIFKILSLHGLKLKLSKCTFAATRVQYLGHVVDASGVQVDPEKVVGICKMPYPTKVVELQSFLGMTGYYRRFINNDATLSKPLVILLKKDQPWIWTPQCAAAVEEFKRQLTTAPILAMPDYKRRFLVQTDASKMGVGAVLSQRYDSDNGKQIEKPVSFISRTLKKHENNYSVTHLEMLAVIWALKKFRHYILGTRFLLQTDHLALQTIRGTKELYTGRMGRWVLWLQEYEPFDIQYRKGINNANADALSRLPVPKDVMGEEIEQIVNLPEQVTMLTEEEVEQKHNEREMEERQHDINDVSKLQQQDETWADIYAYRQNPSHSHSEAMQRQSEQYTIIEGVLYRRCLANGTARQDNLIVQLCLPKVMVPMVLQELHDEPYSGHLSTQKTWQKAYNRYYWPTMHRDIAHYCESCIVCARRKVPSRMSGIPLLSPQQDWITSYGPMECIAIDVIGPITTSHRASLILTIVDVYTRYGCAIPLLQQNTKSIVTALVQRWFILYGIPRAIISDNGPGFASKVMRGCLKLMGIQTRYILPYHPQANMCERLNKTIINMVASYTQEEDTQAQWSQYLLHVVFAYNTSTHSETGYSPYQLTFGREALIGSEPFITSTHIHEMGRSYPAYVRQLHRHMHMAYRHIQQKVMLKTAERDKMNEQLKSTLSFDIGDKVMIYVLPVSKNNTSKKLLSPYIGPCTVINIYNEVSYQVQIDGTTKKKIVHVSRMKKFILRHHLLQDKPTLSPTTTGLLRDDQVTYDELEEGEVPG